MLCAAHQRATRVPPTLLERFSALVPAADVSKTDMLGAYMRAA